MLFTLTQGHIKLPPPPLSGNRNKLLGKKMKWERREGKGKRGEKGKWEEGMKGEGKGKGRGIGMGRKQQEHKIWSFMLFSSGEGKTNNKSTKFLPGKLVGP